MSRATFNAASSSRSCLRNRNCCLAARCPSLRSFRNPITTAGRAQQRGARDEREPLQPLRPAALFQGGVQFVLRGAAQARAGHVSAGDRYFGLRAAADSVYRRSGRECCGRGGSGNQGRPVYGRRDVAGRAQRSGSFVKQRSEIREQRSDAPVLFDLSLNSRGDLRTSCTLRVFSRLRDFLPSLRWFCRRLRSANPAVFKLRRTATRWARPVSSSRLRPKATTRLLWSGSISRALSMRCRRPRVSLRPTSSTTCN